MSVWHITITNQGDHLEEIRRSVMAQQDTIDALAAQLDKARGEIVKEIARLEDLVASGGGEQLDFTVLKQRVQSLDDVVAEVPGGENPTDPTQPTEPTEPAPEPAPAPETGQTTA
ncbi:hypothetical protein ACWEO2_17690 [Nocardia sp. NPDC004278]